MAKTSNPFSVGDRVVCMEELKSAIYVAPRTGGLSAPVRKFPTFGEELVVDGVHRGLLRFRSYDTNDVICWWPYSAFMSVSKMVEEIGGLLQ